jgi:hypothetical protein
MRASPTSWLADWWPWRGCAKNFPSNDVVMGVLRFTEISG